MVPCIMELGGKCPTIVDQGCDISNAAAKVSFGRFSNSGQTCIAPDHVYVHENIKDIFLRDLEAKVKCMYSPRNPNH